MTHEAAQKRLIYECIIVVKDEKWETYTSYLENELETVAEAEKWCPDWTYEVHPTDEKHAYEIKVWGEIEEED